MNERITLTVGLFDRNVALGSVLRDLEANGFDGGRFRIIVATDSHAFEPSWLSLIPRVALVERVSTAGWFTEQGDLVIEKIDSALPWLTGGHTMPSHAATPLHDGAAKRAIERQTLRLSKHLVGGGALVVARVDSVADQQSICSMMLHYASGGVLIHQVRSAALAGWLVPRGGRTSLASIPSSPA